MKLLARIAAIGIVVFIALQAVRPGIPTAPATAEIQAPLEVKHILEKHCYACHSDQRRLAWFDQIVPGYWLVRHDILTARKHLNFSTLGAKPAAAQRATLFEAVSMIQLGAMPLPQFTALHPDAKVTPEELATLKAYLSPWSDQPTPAASPSTSETPAINPVDFASVKPELNKLPFDPTFEDWKLLNITDRGDNNTLRFILGNDIAMKAAQSGAITPWPDGARLAKVAWQKQPGADGLVHPGKFIQVELMIKDAYRYRQTEGWGWGRWRGLDLKPYGKDAAFVTECTSCHLPLRGNDYVYTLPITPAIIGSYEIVDNPAAALPANLPYQPLGWSPITLYVDQKTKTTAVLYGNEIAVLSPRPRGIPVPAAYKPGAVLALVTWSQRDDPHWFGARIPHAPQSVEFVIVPDPDKDKDTDKPTYRRFNGNRLTEDQANDLDPRKDFILKLTPPSLP